MVALLVVVILYKQWSGPHDSVIVIRCGVCVCVCVSHSCTVVSEHFMLHKKDALNKSFIEKDALNKSFIVRVGLDLERQAWVRNFIPSYLMYMGE